MFGRLTGSSSDVLQPCMEKAKVVVASKKMFLSGTGKLFRLILGFYRVRARY